VPAHGVKYRTYLDIYVNSNGCESKLGVITSESLYLESLLNAATIDIRNMLDSANAMSKVE
jgi:hypothetical protein